MKRNSTLALPFAAAIALGGVSLAAPPTSAEEQVIRVLTFAPPNRDDLSMVIFRKYMKSVNDAGKGIVKLDLIGGPEVVPVPNQVDAVSKGIADWVMTFTIHASRVPEVDTVGLSRITPQEERKVGYIELLDNAHKRINIKVIGRTATNGGFHIFSKKALKTLADFKGLKIRSHSGYDAFFNALGASPIHMKISEIYTGLERGLVQAAPYPLFVSNLGLHEVVSYAMADSFWDSHTTVSYMNLEKWNGLPETAKKIITNNQLKLEDEMAAMANELKAAERKRLEAKGMNFTSLSSEEATKFKKMAVDSRWAAIKPKLAPELFKKFESMIRR